MHYLFAFECYLLYASANVCGGSWWKPYIPKWTHFSAPHPILFIHAEPCSVDSYAVTCNWTIDLFSFASINCHLSARKPLLGGLKAARLRVLAGEREHTDERDANIFSLVTFCRQFSAHFGSLHLFIFRPFPDKKPHGKIDHSNTHS